jgi:hypothetical protein
LAKKEEGRGRAVEGRKEEVRQREAGAEERRRFSTVAGVS